MSHKSGTYYLEGGITPEMIADIYHFKYIRSRASQAIHVGIENISITPGEIMRMFDAIDREQDRHEDTKALLGSREIELQDIATANERLRGRIAYLEADNARLESENGVLTARLELGRLLYAEYMNYRNRNTLNFQLEKADSYIGKIGEAIGSEA